MKKFACVLFCIVCLLTFSEKIKAQPLAGLDLYLISLGGNDYQVTFVYYRDCSYISAPSAVAMQFTCASNPGYNFTLPGVAKLPGTGQDITPACSGVPTKCSGGSIEGYQEHVYQTQVVLPPCNNWVVSALVCCRTTTNTSSSGGYNGYIKTTMNNVDFPGNSSPYFTSNPIRMLCAGQTNLIDHGAIDPDGDSLAFSMVSPFISSSTNIAWLPPYTPTQPILSNPPVTIDPVTGKIIMTPTMNLTSQMSLKVEQWRNLNGVPTIVGTSYRETKLNVITCNNQIPLLSGMDTTLVHGYTPNDSIFYREVCLDDTVSFAIWGYDADTANASLPGNHESFNLSWNQGIPQASFQVFHQDSDSAFALFHWIPTASDRKLRYFTVTIHDLACPYYGVQNYTYCIETIGISVTLTPDTSVCRGESILYLAVTDPPASDYLWSIDGVPVLTPGPSNSLYVSSTGMSDGLHVISVEALSGNPGSACTAKAASHLTVHPLPTISLGNDTCIASGATIVLDAGPGFSVYLWSSGQTGQYCIIDSSGTGIGTNTVWVQVTDSNGCSGTDTIRIRFDQNPGIANPSGDMGMLIYPNPSDGYLRMHLSYFPAGNYELEIFSRDGRLMQHSEIILSGQGDEIGLALDFITDGFYYIRISGAGKTATEKLVLHRNTR